MPSTYFGHPFYLFRPPFPFPEKGEQRGHTAWGAAVAPALVRL